MLNTRITFAYRCYCYFALHNSGMNDAPVVISFEISLATLHSLIHRTHYIYRYQPMTFEVPSVVHTLYRFSDLQSASRQSWPSGSPSVSPHTLQIFGFTQSASCQSWPSGLPRFLRTPYKSLVRYRLHLQICEYVHSQKASIAPLSK